MFYVDKSVMDYSHFSSVGLKYGQTNFGPGIWKNIEKVNYVIKTRLSAESKQNLNEIL